ncbi:MAG: cupin fold WbuC family metalloprotein [Paracoccaceae bacterium]|jgi:cupin fold WbuC family metalloprotein
MPNALPNPTGDLFLLNDAILSEGKKASRQSPRRRIVLPVQRSQDALVQRLLNFLQPGTYIRPHRHPLPHATESICLLSGSLEILIFDQSGTVQSRHRLSASSPLIDLEPDLWHGMIVLEADTVIFEVKRGPYDPATDKEFASWSPQEDSPEVAAYLTTLA